MANRASGPQDGDRVYRPLLGVPYHRTGTVSSVVPQSRSKYWIQVEWDDGKTGWYALDDLDFR